MKLRLIALVSVLTLLLAFFAGCGSTGTTPGGSDSGDKTTNAPQLVVAMNPLLVYGDTDTVVGYNDVQKAMATDSQNSSLTALGQSSWQWWTQKSEGSWMQRATYDWGKWTSGTGAQVKGIFAYAFNADGNTSLALYNKQNAQLTPYGSDVAADAGLLLSVTGSQEEALTYVAAKDGVITIPAGTLTAISEVNGVKTGFLAEDGTARSASVRLMVNSAQVWSGTLHNTTAGTDGQAVTQLSYPQINDLHVKAGDLVYFCFKLDAQANAADDVTAPTINEEDNWLVTKKSKTVKVENVDENGVNTDVILKDGSIRLIMDYMFTFKLVRDMKYSTMVAKMAYELMMNTEAEVFVAKPDAEEVPYEIIIGEYADRPLSVQLTKELKSYRSDNVSDFRIKLDGTKVYIVAANDTALQAAVDFFMATFGQTDKGKIPENYDYIYRPEHKPVMLAGQNIANYTIRTERNPSLVLRKAAEAIQTYVRDTCGYLIEIRKMNIAANDFGKNEIRIGPMNGNVEVDRVLDTVFDYTTEKTVGQLHIDEDGYIPGDLGYYEVGFEGKNLIVNGGSDYACNVAVARLMKIFYETNKLDATYTDKGNYTSGYDYFNRTKYDTVNFDMTGGYGLVLQDNFDFEISHEETEKSIRSRWTVNTDQGPGCDTETEMQWRPGYYGENWWVTTDSQGNGYLMEITKRAYRQKNFHNNQGEVMPGYDAVRIVSANKFGWRFGISETRIVMGSRNGACSAVWYASGGYPGNQPAGMSNEFDLYENYGRELLVPNSYANHSTHTTMATSHGQTLGWVEPREGENFYATFHHVTMEWDYNMIHYYFDGEEYCEIPLNDNNAHAPLRIGTTWKLANGIGSGYYSALLPDLSRGGPTYNPVDFMGEENLDKFFEVQIVDYIRLYQTTNVGKAGSQQNQFVYIGSFDDYHRGK